MNLFQRNKDGRPQLFKDYITTHDLRNLGICDGGKAWSSLIINRTLEKQLIDVEDKYNRNLHKDVLECLCMEKYRTSDVHFSRLTSVFDYINALDS
jgi:hypothetical protein